MVVVAKENMDLMMDIIQRFQHRKVRVVPGGSTRHRSICSGVLALGEAEREEEGEQTLLADRPKVVIIHDAVRPFVEEDFLYKIAIAAKEQGVSMVKTLVNLDKNSFYTLHLLLFLNNIKVFISSFELCSLLYTGLFGQVRTINQAMSRNLISNYFAY